MIGIRMGRRARLEITSGTVVAVRPSMVETTALGAAVAAGTAEGVNIWKLDLEQPVTCDTFTPSVTQKGKADTFTPSVKQIGEADAFTPFVTQKGEADTFTPSVLQTG